jgi:hypothetical protein
MLMAGLKNHTATARAALVVVAFPAVLRFRSLGVFLVDYLLWLDCHMYDSRGVVVEF